MSLPQPIKDTNKRVEELERRLNELEQQMTELTEACKRKKPGPKPKDQNAD